MHRVHIRSLLTESGKALCLMFASILKLLPQMKIFSLLTLVTLAASSRPLESPPQEVRQGTSAVGGT